MHICISYCKLINYEIGYSSICVGGCLTLSSPATGPVVALEWQMRLFIQVRLYSLSLS